MNEAETDMSDFQLYQSVVEATHQYKDLFVCDN